MAVCFPYMLFLYLERPFPFAYIFISGSRFLSNFTFILRIISIIKIFVYLISMPPRKAADEPPIAKNNGKSSSGKYSDEHPE